MLKASIQIKEATYITETQVLQVVLENISSSDLMFENQMPYTLYSKPPVFEIPAGETVTLQIKTLEKMESISLDLKALGAYTAPKEQPVISWNVIVE